LVPLLKLIGKEKNIQINNAGPHLCRRACFLEHKNECDGWMATACPFSIYQDKQGMAKVKIKKSGPLIENGIKKKSNYRNEL